MERAVIEPDNKGGKEHKCCGSQIWRKTSRSHGKEIAAYEGERGGVLGFDWNFMFVFVIDKANC